jgi:ABC-2 type transport system permease protein
VTFVRLKLRIMGNALRGQAWRVVLFLFGVFAGLFMATAGFFGFLLAAGDPDRRRSTVVLAFLGAAFVLGWVFAPLLYFGVDETLDPARFALLPLPRRTLAVGMLAAACVGIPAVATLVASLGLVVGGAIRGGPGAALVGLLGAAIGLLLCVVASRAVTSAFAGLLRRRRTRDLAAILIAVLASSCGPLNLLVQPIVQHGRLDQAAKLAGTVAWTPFAAPYVAVVDASAGRWPQALARLAVGAAGVALLLWWWSRTIESAMVGTETSGVPGAGRTGPGIVDSLYPVLLRGVPRNRFGAVLAREARYWWRDPRRRAGLISLTMAGVVVPVALRITSGGRSGAPLPLAVAFAGVLAGTVLANQFGTDGSAYAAHLLTGLPGRLELWARAAGLATVMLPVLATVTTAVALATHGAAQLPAALGTVAAAFACSAAVASVISVLAPYALPETSNPFAMSGGSAGAKGLLAFVGMLSAMALLAPVLLLALLAPPAWRWVALPVGLGWGLAALTGATALAGGHLDRRQPEILMAVTPRR